MDQDNTDDVYQKPHDLKEWTALFISDHGSKNGNTKLHARIRQGRNEGFKEYLEPELLAELVENYPKKIKKDANGHLNLVTVDQVKEWLYRSGKPAPFGIGGVRAITDHLYKHGILPTETEATPDDSVRKASNAMRDFLKIQKSTMGELIIRAPGNYWLYRPSQNQPGNFLRGLLTIEHLPGLGEDVLKVTEIIQTQTETDGFQHIARSDGFMLQNGRFPFILTSRQVTKIAREQLEMERGSVQFTIISSALTHEDGKFVSMSGLISGSYSLSQATNVPVVLERIHASYETKTGKILLDEKVNKRLAIIELNEMQKDHAAILRRLTLKIDDGIIKL